MSLTDRTLKLDPGVTSRGVDLGSVGSLGLDGDFTVETWVKLQTFGRHLLGIGGVNALIAQSDLLRCEIGGFDVACALQPSVWYHLALRYTAATKEAAVFVNGELAGAFVAPAAFTPQSTDRILLGHSSASPASSRYDGHVAEVRVFKIARARAQIQAEMFRHLGGREDGLAAYFPLDGRTGDTATAARDATVVLDPITLAATGAARPSGTITGAAFVQSDLPLQRSPDGIAPPADVVVAAFNGVHSCITVPHAPALQIESAITVEAWVRPTGTGRPVHAFPVVSKHGAGKGWELRAGGGRAGFLVTVGGVYHELKAPLENDVWHAVAGVYGGGFMRLYVNGVLVASKAASGPITQYPAELTLGGNSYWPDQKFAGQIAEVRIFNEARTQPTLQQGWLPAQRFASGGVVPGLVALYRMEGSAEDARGLSHGAAQYVLWSVSDPPLPASPAAAKELAASDELHVIVAENAALIEESAALRDSLAREKSAHDAVRLQLPRRQWAIAQRAQDVATKTNSLNDFLVWKAMLVTRDARLAELTAELDRLQNPPEYTSLTDVTQKLTGEVERARAALAAAGGDHALTGVQLSMKMVPAAGGVTAMKFPTLAEMRTLKAEHLSTLDLDIEAREAGAAAASQVIVPSVVSYTEAVARRKLGAASLRADVSFQAVRAVDGHAGDANRVVAQLPRPGTAVAPGSSVTIFIGRES